MKRTQAAKPCNTCMACYRARHTHEPVRSTHKSQHCSTYKPQAHTRKVAFLNPHAPRALGKHTLPLQRAPQTALQHWQMAISFCAHRTLCRCGDATPQRQQLCRLDHCSDTPKWHSGGDRKQPAKCCLCQSDRCARKRRMKQTRPSQQTLAIQPTPACLDACLHQVLLPQAAVQIIRCVAVPVHDQHRAEDRI